MPRPHARQKSPERAAADELVLAFSRNPGTVRYFDFSHPEAFFPKDQRVKEEFASKKSSLKRQERGNAGLPHDPKGASRVCGRIAGNAVSKKVADGRAYPFFHVVAPFFSNAAEHVELIHFFEKPWDIRRIVLTIGVK